MSVPITILIPTHNRHGYLERSLEYYKNSTYPVLVLDSSAVAYKQTIPAIVQYVHLPQIPLPEKLFYGFSTIKTEYVVMCADDDFLVINGVNQCLRFLQTNHQYTVADGGVLFYKKDGFNQEPIFNLLYKTGLDITFDSTEPLERLHHFFKNYRSVFYGVHYTSNLKIAYQSCFQAFSNLYLNEYLTALLPVAAGYCKILPVLIAVRESTAVSDDKTTVNLDMMFNNATYQVELTGYISCVTNIIHTQCGIALDDCIQTVTDALKNYAVTITSLKQNEQQQYLSFTKKVGSMVLKIPLIGTAFVRHRRKKQSQNEIATLVKTSQDRDNLQRISQYIQQYRSIC